MPGGFPVRRQGGRRGKAQPDPLEAQIAELLGITQETSIRLLKSFKEEGILEIKRKEIIMKSLARLKALGEEAPVQPGRPLHGIFDKDKAHLLADHAPVLSLLAFGAIFSYSLLKYLHLPHGQPDNLHSGHDGPYRNQPFRKALHPQGLRHHAREVLRRQDRRELHPGA